jgi:hypothetical protein
VSRRRSTRVPPFPNPDQSEGHEVNLIQIKFCELVYAKFQAGQERHVGWVAGAKRRIGFSEGSLEESSELPRRPEGGAFRDSLTKRLPSVGAVFQLPDVMRKSGMALLPTSS